MKDEATKLATRNVSSAMVERVFSQLNFMSQVIGSQALEETSEARLMLRCNHHSFDDLDL